MILRNFRLKKGDSIQEYPRIKLIESEYVFTDMPLCELDQVEEDAEELYIVDVHPYTNIARVTTRDKVNVILSKTKIFHLKPISDNPEEANNSKLIETTKELAIKSIRLPLNTEVDKLCLINGEIMMLDNQVEVKEGE